MNEVILVRNEVFYKFTYFLTAKSDLQDVDIIELDIDSEESHNC